MNSFAQRGTDFNRIELLESVKNPTKFDKVNLCALIMRYGENQKVSLRLYNLAAGWDYSPVTLMQECREIWLSGFRPDQTETTGSGYDTNSNP
jgi:hypothetical protein